MKNKNEIQVRVCLVRGNMVLASYFSWEAAERALARCKGKNVYLQMLTTEDGGMTWHW